MFKSASSGIAIHPSYCQIGSFKGNCGFWKQAKVVWNHFWYPFSSVKYSYIPPSLFIFLKKDTFVYHIGILLFLPVAENSKCVQNLEWTELLGSLLQQFLPFFVSSVRTEQPQSQVCIQAACKCQCGDMYTSPLSLAIVPILESPRSPQLLHCFSLYHPRTFFPGCG